MFASIKRWTALERVSRPERLDSEEHSYESLRQILGELELMNRWLGGYAILRRFVFPRMRRMDTARPFRVLELACGGAGASVQLARWARKNGIAVKIVALDFLPRHLHVARDAARAYPEITFVQADARQLPFAGAGFDFVISTLFLHHLEEAELVEALGSWASVCRGSLVLNDLIRGRAPLLLFRIAAPLLSRSEITVEDGLISIARAYRPSELRRILSHAGLETASIHSDGIYHRMTVVSR